MTPERSGTAAEQELRRWPALRQDEEDGVRLGWARGRPRDYSEDRARWMANVIPPLLSTCAALRVERDRLAAALSKYGWHIMEQNDRHEATWVCPAMEVPPGPCDPVRCGFDAALTPASGSGIGASGSSEGGEA